MNSFFSSPLVRRISAIVLGVCAVVFSFCTVLQTTVLNEQLFADNLSASMIVYQKVDQQIDTFKQKAEGTSFDVEGARLTISQAVVPSINNSITQIVFHPDNATESFEQEKSKILNSIFNALTSSSDQIKELVRSPIGTSIGVASANLKDSIHFDRLVDIGYTLQAIQIVCVVAMIVTGILGLASLIVLFIAKRGGLAALTLLISAAVTLVLMLIVMFIPIGGEIYTDLVKSIQQSVTSNIGFSALILAGAAVLCGAATYLFNKTLGKS